MSLGVEHMSFYVFVGAPPGPDPRRAPQGPIPAGPHQGPGEGPAGPRAGPRGGPRAQGRAPQGPGPDVRAKRALDSSIYIYIYIYICGQDIN